MCIAASTLSANLALNSNHASASRTMIIFKLPVAAQWPLRLGVRVQARAHASASRCQWPSMCHGGRGVKGPLTPLGTAEGAPPRPPTVLKVTPAAARASHAGGLLSAAQPEGPAHTGTGMCTHTPLATTNMPSASSSPH